MLLCSFAVLSVRANRDAKRETSAALRKGMEFAASATKEAGLDFVFPVDPDEKALPMLRFRSCVCCSNAPAVEANAAGVLIGTFCPAVSDNALAAGVIGTSWS